jgi:hypothetical protein
MSIPGQRLHQHPLGLRILLLVDGEFPAPRGAENPAAPDDGDFHGVTSAVRHAIVTALRSTESSP